MALNPEIALGYRPPQVNLDIPSPIHQFGQLMSLRQMMEQSQVRKLELEQERMKIDAAQRAQRDDQILRQSYADAGGDLDKTQAFLIDRGGSPTALMNLRKQALDARKTLAEIGDKELGAVKYKHDQVYGLLNQALALPDDQYAAQWPTLTQTALAIDPNLKLPGAPIPKDQLKTMALGFTTQDQLLKQEQDRRDALKTKAEIATKDAETAKNNLAAQQTRQMLNARTLLPAIQKGPDSEAFKTALAGLLPEDQAVFQGVKNERELWQRLLTPEQRQQAEQTAATATETARHNKAVETAAAATAGEMRRHHLATEAGSEQESGALADVVIANPALYNELTPTAKTKIAPTLAAKGYTQFGKQMSESALTKLSESRSAIQSLQDLRTTLKDNEQYIGPISGFQALNPYSDAQKAQAKINLVRQRVGKALEGGVLRKEDEDKYKQILATLHDTPATAVSKVDQLIETLQRDIKTFEDEQRRGGRNVVSPPSETPKTAVPKVGDTFNGAKVTKVTRIE